MNRYLINVSYIGTHFRGLQKQVKFKESEVIEEPDTIQGRIEIALKKLKSVNYPYTTCSSRTDAGVHALHNTFHVDLERKNGEPYEPEVITHVLNKSFNETNTAIRAINTYLVPSDFHCRKAESRTYMYRLALIPCKHLESDNFKTHLPVEELHRCVFISTSTFDVDKFKAACKLFEGVHDFRTFMHRGSKQPDKITKRCIDRIELLEGKSCELPFYSWPYIRPKVEYKYYNFFITSKGFLYNQVRRTIGALVAVAKGKVTDRDLKFMLQVPSQHSWDSRIKPLPPYGLYLCEVRYSPLSLSTFKDRL